MKKQFRFYTEYNQFYIQDKNSQGDTSASDFWTEMAFDNRLAVSNDLLGISTQSYGNIQGEIEWLPTKNEDIDLTEYDHIVEAGIEITSGELQIIDCPSSQIQGKIKLNNGKYRVRVYSSNLDSVLEPDLAHDSDNDYYKIELWPDEKMDVRVLKQYNG